MSFLGWLLVVIRIVLEAALLGFAWHRSHLSVALLLTALTANAEWQHLLDRLNRIEEERGYQKGKFLQRIRNLQEEPK